MSKIEGRAKKYDGTAIDYVSIFNWVDGKCIEQVIPDATGAWEYDYFSDLEVGITYVADGCEPITHGAYYFNATSDTVINDIGVQGTVSFGIGITDNLPSGMSEMVGTTVNGHENYGNYQYSDGSVMCWIPMFYYRWAGADSPRAIKYGANSLDVKSKYDFDNVEAANAAGYAVHRAFYDNGQLKDGFFVDKYLCSNNNSTASSIKNRIPLSSSSAAAPFSGLTGSPANNFAGAIDAVKTRGSEFFVTTLFVQKALSLLSTAQAQAATSVDDCAWYDPMDVTNYPKGSNNNALGDFDDATIKYTGTGYLKVANTGSGLPFAKTTHNGHSNGVSDINGNMYEICLGITHLSGVFYALKTSSKVSSLTSGASVSTDAWGSAGIEANYESLGENIGALTGASLNMMMGSGTNQVFSGATSGKDWQASCAGIPLFTGVSSVGTDLFGHDNFYHKRAENVSPFSGGYYGDVARAGVWNLSLNQVRTYSTFAAGVRAALYV